MSTDISAQTPLRELERLDATHVFGTWSFQSEVQSTEIERTDGNRVSLADGTEDDIDEAITALDVALDHSDARMDG